MKPTKKQKGRALAAPAIHRREFIAGSAALAGALMLPKTALANLPRNKFAITNSRGEQLIMDMDNGATPMHWIKQLWGGTFDMIFPEPGAALAFNTETGNDPTQAAGGTHNPIGYRVGNAGTWYNNHYRYYGQLIRSSARELRASVRLPKFWISHDQNGWDDYIPRDPRGPHAWHTLYNDPRRTYGGFQPRPPAGWPDFYDALGTGVVFAPRSNDVPSGIMFPGNYQIYRTTLNYAPHRYIAPVHDGRIAFRMLVSFGNSRSGTAGFLFRKDLPTDQSTDIHDFYNANGLHLSIDITTGTMGLHTAPAGGSQLIWHRRLTAQQISRLRQIRTHQAYVGHGRAGGSWVEVRTSRLSRDYMEIYLDEIRVGTIRDPRIDLRGPGFALWAHSSPGNHVLFSQRNVYDMGKELNVRYWADGIAFRAEHRLDCERPDPNFHHFGAVGFFYGRVLGQTPAGRLDVNSHGAYSGMRERHQPDPNVRDFELRKGGKLFFGPYPQFGMTCRIDDFSVDGRFQSQYRPTARLMGGHPDGWPGLIGLTSVDEAAMFVPKTARRFRSVTTWWSDRRL